jgi:hypothetical protein
MQAAIVVNPSFESNYNDQFPHYGAIDNWTGGSGVNESGGPFHNGGTPIPDTKRVAFMQNSGNMSQDITGLQAGKRYLVQFFYDARACCGGSIDLATKINDNVLDTIPNIKPSTGGDPYRLHTVFFTAEADTATLTFSSIVPSGDATVDIDAVTVVQRDTGNLIIANPSFEATGDVTFHDDQGNLVPNDGLLVDPVSGEPVLLAGWDAMGEYGVNASGVGPYADNGTPPDQDHVGVLHGVSSLSQTFKVVQGKPYQLSLAYNAKTGNSPHIQIKAGDTVLFEEDLTSVGGTAAYKTKTVSFTPSDVNATITIAQTKEGDQALLLDDVKVTGEVPPDIDPTALTPDVAEIEKGEQVDIGVKVAADILATKDITIGLQASDNSVVRFVDPSGALLPRVNVTFTKGGSNQKTLKIQGISRGTATIQIFDPAGLPIKNQIAVTVVQDPLKNPSFESTPVPAGVGYGAIANWNGGSGINDSKGPFADNGVIPDRLQVGFQQGAGTLSQTVNGLVPGKNYWLQFFYNVRNGSVMDLSVNLGGKELLQIPGITPAGDGVPYYFQNIPFVADSANPLLEFKTTPTGDSTLLLDGVNIVQRDPGQVVVRNPSFEASGAVYPFPGYFAAVAGWDVSGGGRGVNIDGAGPFTDNGRANAGDLVLFMQGNGASVSQNLTGLTAGQKYLVAFLLNARTGGGPEDSSYLASFNDVSLLEETLQPVGGANPYLLKQAEFTADGQEGVLKFQGTTPSGDHTILLDNVVVLPSNAKAFILSHPQPLNAAVGDSATFHVVAVGGGNLTYQWKKDGQMLAGQTTDTLTLDSLTLAMGGNYTVDVTNAGGTTTSDAARLSVLDRVPGVYSTGVKDDGSVLDDGATDTHYTLVTNVDDPTSNTVFVQDSTVFPISTGNWVAESDLSKWVGPRVDPSGEIADGDYVYRMNLDLTGFDPATVILTGMIASDNSVTILVNGTDTGISQSGFGALETRTISGVFKPGVNQVDFKVNNGAPPGPTGLRIEGLTALGVSTGVSQGPKLTITKSGQTVRVAWPSSATGVTLQTASDIKGPWSPSNLPVQTAGNESFIVDNIAATGSRFYTLKK